MSIRIQCVDLITLLNWNIILYLIFMRNFCRIFAIRKRVKKYIKTHYFDNYNLFNLAFTRMNLKFTVYCLQYLNY